MTAWAAGVVIAGIVLFFWKSWRNYKALPQLPALSGSGGGVTVIVPARNEAHQIERCLASFECPVVVVDDGSEDGTAAAAVSAGARVVAAPALAEGEMGKPNACAAGALEAHSEWLLFVDADTWYTEGFAGALAAYAERERLDLVSAFLRQERVSLAERCILPYAFALYFCGVSARGVNSAESAEALANGQCLLIRCDAYERIGGHGAVKRSVIEDVALARLAKTNGLRVRVVRAERVGSVRMYEGFASIWRGLEKNSFRFLQANPWTGAQVIAASIFMTSWVPVVVLSRDWRMAVSAAAAPFLVLYPWYGSWRDVLLAPLGVYAFQMIALAGMVKAIGGLKSTWKGRRV